MNPGLRRPDATWMPTPARVLGVALALAIAMPAIADQPPPGATPEATAAEPPARETVLDLPAAPGTPTSPTPATPAPALAEPVQAATTPEVHLTLATEIVSGYYFRGILQEDRGLIVQPSLSVSALLARDDDFSVTIDLGTWNSLHDRATGAGSNTDIDDKWYECDLTGGVTLASGPLSVRAFYTWYSSPSGAFREVHEVAATLAYDDTAVLGKLALHPALTIARELGPNGADGPGNGAGTYLELALTPGLDLVPRTDDRGWGLRLTFPQVLGVSLSNYYQNAAGARQTFGFYETGARLTATAPTRGAATLSFWGGVRALFLGDGARELNRDREGTEVIGVVGASVGF